MPDALFWELTPRLLRKLIERYQARERLADLRAGLIAAELRNVNRAETTDKVWTALDYFPQEQPNQREQTDEEMLLVLRAWVSRMKDR